MQSIAGLPESACFVVGGLTLEIINHKVQKTWIYPWMINAMRRKEWRHALTLMGSNEINYEGVVETIISDMENPTAFGWVLNMYGMSLHHGTKEIFAKSEAGINMREKITDKIRDCANWTEFYAEMNPESRFIQCVVR